MSKNQKRGIYSILKIPIIYEFQQWLFRHKKTKKKWNSLIRSVDNEIVLDVGCGTGKTSLDFLNSKKYIGIDISREYIDNAKLKYGDFGEFYCLPIEKIDEGPTKNISNIDLILLKGVYHHLDDTLIKKMIITLKKKLNKNGKIISIDPTYKSGFIFSNFIVSLDRGNFVRKPKNLLKILSKDMEVHSKEIIYQIFPPYQRIIITLKNK